MVCTQWCIHVCAWLFFVRCRLKSMKLNWSSENVETLANLHATVNSFYVWSVPITDQVVFNIHVLWFLFIFKCHLACWKYHSIECCDSEKIKYTEVWWEDFAKARKCSTLVFFVYVMLFDMFFHYLISVFVVSVRASQPGGQKPLEGLSMLLRGPQDDLFILCQLVIVNHYKQWQHLLLSLLVIVPNMSMSCLHWSCSEKEGSLDVTTLNLFSEANIKVQ